MTVYRGNPAVRIRPVMTLEKDGVCVSELRLGSHTGTHVDAPSHFIKGERGTTRGIPSGSWGRAGVAVFGAWKAASAPWARRRRASRAPAGAASCARATPAWGT